MDFKILKVEDVLWNIKQYLSKFIIFYIIILFIPSQKIIIIFENIYVSVFHKMKI